MISLAITYIPGDLADQFLTLAKEFKNTVIDFYKRFKLAATHSLQSTIKKTAIPGKSAARVASAGNCQWNY